MDHPDDNDQQESNLPQQHLNLHGSTASRISSRQQQPQQRHHTGSVGSGVGGGPYTMPPVAGMSAQFPPIASDQSRRLYPQQEPPPRVSNAPPPSSGGGTHGMMYGHEMEYHVPPYSSYPIAHQQQQQQYPQHHQQPPPIYHRGTGQIHSQQPPPPTSYQPSNPHQNYRPHPPHISMHQQPQQSAYMQQQHMNLTDPQQQQQQQQPYFPSASGRRDRPLVKLSLSLIDTYRQINRVYYDERDARRAARAAQRPAGGVSQQHPNQQPPPPQLQQTGINNHGWDDENYDYIITPGDILNDRYVIKERIGKGSFGQVVRALDQKNNIEVAVKIIKSKRPFLMQAKTEIELLASVVEKADQNNIVRLSEHFLFRNHQCLVFEMLSLNLYELLKNTQFCGVSLNLIRKFAKQILKALSFLARSDIDIIHCDLKPENILLKHPKRSGIKVIDFGSSCKSNKRMYSYIQSRFYRSPEVMLGLPYTVSIDMWSLGCILVEMHTGEPLFSGSDQFDQMQKIVKVLGMVPFSMIDRSSDQHRLQFFQKGNPPDPYWIMKQNPDTSKSTQRPNNNNSNNPTTIPSQDPKASLSEVIGAESSRTKKYPTNEPGHTTRNYESFVDLIHKMLAHDPRRRIKPEEALRHPFIAEGEQHHFNSIGSTNTTRRNSSNFSSDDLMSSNVSMRSTVGRNFGNLNTSRRQAKESNETYPM